MLAAGVVVDSFVKIKPARLGGGDVLIGPRCHLNAGVVIYSGNGVASGATSWSPRTSSSRR